MVETTVGAPLITTELPTVVIVTPGGNEPEIKARPVALPPKL